MSATNRPAMNIATSSPHASGTRQTNPATCRASQKSARHSPTAGYTMSRVFLDEIAGDGFRFVRRHQQGEQRPSSTSCPSFHRPAKAYPEAVDGRARLVERALPGRLQPVEAPRAAAPNGVPAPSREAIRPFCSRRPSVACTAPAATSRSSRTRTSFRIARPYASSRRRTMPAARPARTRRDVSHIYAYIVYNKGQLSKTVLENWVSQGGPGFNPASQRNRRVTGR